MDFLDVKINVGLDNEPFHWACSLAEVLTVSHSPVLDRLHDSLGMKDFHLGWIPHALIQGLHVQTRKVSRAAANARGHGKD
jgi:hypothetical protein